MKLPEALTAIGFFCTIFSLALPDSFPGSPQTVVLKLGAGLVAAGVYLGARKPDSQPSPVA